MRKVRHNCRNYQYGNWRLIEIRDQLWHFACHLRTAVPALYNWGFTEPLNRNYVILGRSISHCFIRLTSQTTHKSWAPKYRAKNSQNSTPNLSAPKPLKRDEIYASEYQGEQVHWGRWRRWELDKWYWRCVWLAVWNKERDPVFLRRLWTGCRREMWNFAAWCCQRLVTRINWR